MVLVMVECDPCTNLVTHSSVGDGIQLLTSARMVLVMIERQTGTDGSGDDGT